MASVGTGVGGHASYLHLYPPRSHINLGCLFKMPAGEQKENGEVQEGRGRQSGEETRAPVSGPIGLWNTGCEV